MGAYRPVYLRAEAGHAGSSGLRLPVLRRIV
jgi:hypothetical protein